MNFPKVIVDNYADGIAVEPAHGNVFVHNRDLPGDIYIGLEVDYAFSPEAARRLARALKKAADAAEEDYS